MFSIPEQLLTSEQPFFLSEESGYLTHSPTTQFYRINFNTDAYSDQLFEQFSIELPIQLSTAINKRKAEYFAGRYCAKKLLDNKQFPNFELRIGTGRAPCWPESIVGSISHVCDSAAAVVDSYYNLQVLGVDVEKVIETNVIKSTCNTILCSAEKLYLTRCELVFSHAFTATFSMKESLYKALYPEVKKFFDFHSAEVVSLSTERQQISLKLTKTLSEQYQEGDMFTGSYAIEGKHVTTILLTHKKTSD
ncbi:4'-phosphopantetheinyl transferase family protein [Aliivibrio kagoshimensis]|uniref:4'-phosphopantetheinyl transferase family protein n=1 Tax=Aliivibrio kagoshimensis TaxID=2910230 RepID=UPI003D0F8CE1